MGEIPEVSGRLMLLVEDFNHHASRVQPQSVHQARSMGTHQDVAGMGPRSLDADRDGRRKNQAPQDQGFVVQQNLRNREEPGTGNQEPTAGEVGVKRLRAKGIINGCP